MKPLNKYRFNALTFSRTPLANFFVDELEWYSDDGEKILATLTRDRTDLDYGYILLGRDERALFRCIDVDIEYNDIDEARQKLKEKIDKYAEQGEDVFHQGDEKRKKNEIYKQLVSDNKLHTHYKSLVNDELFSPAKEIIAEIVYAFEASDGNYIEQFQSAGFNARLWELYLYAFLHENYFKIERDYSAPDFVCSFFDEPLCIEAVTVNPTDQAKAPKKSFSPDDLQKKLKNFIPIKYGSALFSKLRKRYWEKEHVEGKPFVIAIQDFHEEGSMVWSGSGLSDYLYAYRYSTERDDSGNLKIIPKKIRKHKYGKKEIPSGFFFLPDAENISAVLFNSSATLSKFNRMGKMAGFGSQRVVMRRMGTCYNHDPNASEPLTFDIKVDSEKYFETWSEGASLFHNPNAIYPVNPDILPAIAHHHFDNGFIKSDVPEFHPIGSITNNFIYD